MLEGFSIFVLCVVLNGASSQTIDYLMPTTTQNPTTSCTNSNWDELLPALKLIKSSSSIKKERLLNVVKIIKFLLSDEIEKNQCEKLLQDIKGTNEVPEMPDINSFIEERLGPINNAIDEKPCIKDVDIPQNNTADLSKILAKISAALAKVKERNEMAESKDLTMMPILKKETGCNSDKDKASQAVMSLKSGGSKFNIPCQRAKDILEETSTFVIPKDAYCDLPGNFNMDSILKDPKLNSDKIVPNSVTCVESDDSLAILFKPKKISFMQVYDNLLKKITLTVLVPYHVSKMAL